MAIPAFNEEKTIGEIIVEIRKEYREFSPTIIIVDDGSSDDTARIAKEKGAVVVEHQANEGVARTTNTALEESQKYDKDILVMMDADGQHIVGEIRKIIKPILAGEADIVIGSRFLKEYANMPSMNLFGNKLLSFLVSVLIGKRITDAQSGFRAMRGEFSENMKIESRFTYTQEMILRAAHGKYRIVEVPINVKTRRYGKSRVVSYWFIYMVKVSRDFVQYYLRRWI